MNISVREMMPSDIKHIVRYFVHAEHDYLLGMGADPTKLPIEKDWADYLTRELEKPNTEKEIYYVIWQVDGKPVGHCNINQITYGVEGFMHLHMWDGANRKKGLGLEFVRQSIPRHFANFELERIMCETYSKNSAPLKTLSALGFILEKEYDTTPGVICFPQKVKRFELTKANWIKINS